MKLLRLLVGTSSLLGSLAVVQGFATPSTKMGVRSYTTTPLAVSFLDQDGEIAKLLKKEEEEESKTDEMILQAVQLEQEEEEDTTNEFAAALMEMTKPQDSLFEPPHEIYSSYYNGQYNDDAALAVGVFFLTAVSYLLTIYVPIALNCHTNWV